MRKALNNPVTSHCNARANNLPVVKVEVEEKAAEVLRIKSMTTVDSVRPRRSERRGESYRDNLK